MSDPATPEKSRQVQASAVKQVRLMRANERPNDVLLEITTAKGTQHFLLAQSALPELAEKLAAFNNPAASDTVN